MGALFIVWGSGFGCLVCFLGFRVWVFCLFWGFRVWVFLSIFGGSRGGGGGGGGGGLEGSCLGLKGLYVFRA